MIKKPYLIILLILFYIADISFSFAQLKINEYSDKTICKNATYFPSLKNYVSEWHTKKNNLKYVNEAKRRGLDCGVDKINKTITNKIINDSSKLLHNQNDTNICSKATFEGNWRKEKYYNKFIKEAKRRGLDCGVGINNADKSKQYVKTKRGWLGVLIQEISEEIAESLGMKTTRGAIVASATGGGPAEKAGVKTGDVIIKFNDIEIKNMKELPKVVAVTPVGKSVPLVILRNGKELILNVTLGELQVSEKKNERQLKLDNERRIKKAKEEKKKKETDEARKKKLADEKARKIADEARKKKLADEKARKIAEEKAKKIEKEKKRLNKTIANYKLRARDFYNDITEFVKSGGEIDVLLLTNLFSKRPKINEQWTKIHIKNFEELQSFMSNNQAFISFENRKKEMRLAKANEDKNNTVNSLNDNLKKLKTIIRENFGNDDLVLNVNSNIRLILNIREKKFNQKESDRVLRSTSKFLSDYFNKKKQLKLIDSKLNDKKVELLEISKKEFGSERGDEATRIIHMIDISNSISEKKLILKELEMFLENPIKKQARLDKIEAKKREEEKLRKEAEKKKIAIERKKEIEKEKERKKKRLLGPCYEVSGGWDKTKCLAFVQSLPLKFVCEGMYYHLFRPTYEGTIEVDIKSHNDVRAKTNVYAGGEIIKDKLLTEGILAIVLKKKVENGILIHHERSIKIKIGVAIQYEQIERGDYKHSGYCRERL